VDARPRLAVALCGAALALGALADVLFRGRPLGVNAILWAVAFVAALAALIRIGGVPFHQGRRWMAVPLVLFAALLAWRTSPLLQAVNLLAICGAVAIGALRRTQRPVARAHVDDYVAGAVTAGAATIVGAAELMQRDVPWEELRRGVSAPRVATLARGLALGLPPLLLFGGLFAAADAVFANLLSAAVPSLPHRWWLDVVVVVVVAWASAGLLRDLLATREHERVLSPRAKAPRVGATELAVALGAVDALFLLFVVVQLRYLFGGHGLVETRVGLTYAEYARHGFFELVVVAALVLPLVLAIDGVVDGTRRQVRTVRGFALALIVLVGVVMASALQRLWLYQQQFGLTELRVYATGVVLWLAVVFVWLAVTVLRGRRHLFATGAVVLGFAATLALNVLDPDALIARTNVARPQADVSYLASLSDDALPTLLARLPRLDPRLRRPLARSLLARTNTHESWLSWNRSRSRAASLLARHRDELLALSR
jgi:Domain of unknown function (DUF4153)